MPHKDSRVPGAQPPLHASPSPSHPRLLESMLIYVLHFQNPDTLSYPIRIYHSVCPALQILLNTTVNCKRYVDKLIRHQNVNDCEALLRYPLGLRKTEPKRMMHRVGSTVMQRFPKSGLHTTECGWFTDFNFRQSKLLFLFRRGPLGLKEPFAWGRRMEIVIITS